LFPPGIDVQAELRAKTGSPNLGPTRAPASAHASPNQAPLQQRAILNRQQQRRSLQGPPKADGSNGLPMIQPDGPVQRSPLSQPTPGSHLSSPAQSATRSPNFVAHGQSVSPNFGALPPQQLRPQPPRNNFTPMMGAQRPPLAANQQPPNGLPNASTVGHSVNGMTQSSGPPSFYPSQYSDHMSQLGKLPLSCLCTRLLTGVQSKSMTNKPKSTTRRNRATSRLVPVLSHSRTSHRQTTCHLQCHSRARQRCLKTMVGTRSIPT
jgi:hypothetical protein